MENQVFALSYGFKNHIKETPYGSLSSIGVRRWHNKSNDKFCEIYYNVHMCCQSIWKQRVCKNRQMGDENGDFSGVDGSHVYRLSY